MPPGTSPMSLRAIASRIAFKVIALGFRMPRPKALATFDQWDALISLLKRQRVNVFLDVGANKGFFAKHLRQCGYQGHIFSFEPIKSDCDHIRKLAAGDDKWMVLEHALGSEEKSRQFNVSTISGQTVLSSFLDRKGGSSDTVPVSVQIKRLDEVLPKLIEAIQAPRIFLKMDTQGFDDHVVDGATGCLDLILGLQSEVSVVPLYEGAIAYTDALSRYQTLGFDLIDLFVVNRTTDGRILEYDCLMRRRLRY
jgi:FkbM family methyltransferase